VSILLAFLGTPATPDYIGGVYDVEDWFDEDDDGSFYAFIFEALATQTDVPFLQLQEEDEDEEDHGWQSQAIPLVDNFVQGSFDVDDESDDDDIWQGQNTDAPVADPIISSSYDVDDDIEDDVEAFFLQIAESVAGATDFIQGIFEVDEELVEDDQFDCFSPYNDAPPAPPVIFSINGGLPQFAFKYRYRSKVEPEIVEAIAEIVALSADQSARRAEKDVRKRFERDNIEWKAVYKDVLREILQERDDEDIMLFMLYSE
jgi:hypothetical protein